MLKHFYEQVAGVFPRRMVDRVGLLMVQSGFENIRPSVLVGFVAFFALAVGVIAWFASQFFFRDVLYDSAFALAGFFGVVAAFYIFLVNAADTRASKFENVLPEALTIISANIRAGMTLENAVWSAARPEFGPFRSEIKKVSAETFGGRPISGALEKMAVRVRSEIVSRAVNLINEGIRLGGEMSRLLDEVGEDVRSIELLRKEIVTSTLTYLIFILFASVMAAPILFAVATYYAELNEKILSKQTAGGQVNQQYLYAAGVSGLPGTYFGGPKQGSITSSDVFFFSIAALAVTNFFAALLLALIRKGKALQGVKYAPVFVISSLLIFLATHQVLRTVFKSVIGQ